MITSLATLIFDVTDLPDEHRIGELDRGWKVNCISIAFNFYRKSWVCNYFPELPQFEDDRSVIYLNEQDYLQFLMLSHLAWEDIVNYFNH
ncbi:hypothetical protein nACB1_086 [Acinetobacter phage nACB1]|nr:hypothetical protein nACB1_086 [Acinetobacter phage nACB1]